MVMKKINKLISSDDISKSDADPILDSINKNTETLSDILNSTREQNKKLDKDIKSSKKKIQGIKVPCKVPGITIGNMARLKILNVNTDIVTLKKLLNDLNETQIKEYYMTFSDFMDKSSEFDVILQNIENLAKQVKEEVKTIDGCVTGLKELANGNHKAAAEDANKALESKLKLQIEKSEQVTIISQIVSKLTVLSNAYNMTV